MGKFVFLELTSVNWFHLKRLDTTLAYCFGRGSDRNLFELCGFLALVKRGKTTCLQRLNRLGQHLQTASEGKSRSLFVLGGLRFFLSFEITHLYLCGGSAEIFRETYMFGPLQIIFGVFKCV